MLTVIIPTHNSERALVPTLTMLVPGALTGTVREVISRNMARFRGEGLIRIQGHQVRIVNRAGLEQEAESQG